MIFPTFSSTCRHFKPILLIRKLSSIQPKVENVVLRDIVQRIKINGPISVAEYMKIVLTSPRDGFYMKQDVFGSKGHFTTSPEVSQIFGELVAVWLISEWQRVGCPSPFRIIELGPGRGTLASDISRVVSQVSTTRHETILHLVEVSPHLTKIQQKTIAGQESDTSNMISKHGIPVSWYRNIEEVKSMSTGFNAFVANELFDALPVHKFQKNEKGIWCELMIDFERDDKLRYITTRGETPATKAFVKKSHSSLRHLEVSPESGVICNKVIDILNTSQNGCFLICDYGFDDPDFQDRDTFRAFHKHQQCDPLTDPGSADLTADVDFIYLKTMAEQNSLVFGPVNQRDFLIQVGIGLRLKKLLENTKSEEDKKTLKSGVDKIINDMGQRFKFLSIFPKCNKDHFQNNPPAGFS